MTETSDDRPIAPSAAERVALLCEELGRPLRAASTKLSAHRAQNPHAGLREAMRAVTEAETNLATLVALGAGLVPDPRRASLDLGAMIVHTLRLLPSQAGPRVALTLPEPVVGQWNFWMCRRLVREVLAFPLAISDRVPVVSARRTAPGAVFSVHLQGADMSSTEAETLRRELGPSPRQFHLWIAARLAQMHGGDLRVELDAHGWVGLTATLPERGPVTGGAGEARGAEVTPDQRRALIHMLRSPISAARLRLNLVDEDQVGRQLLVEVERHLVTADAAIARLTPLTGGPAVVEPIAGDLVTLVAPAIRAGAPFATLRTVGALRGRWDSFAVECIARNLLVLGDGRTMEPVLFALRPAPHGAVLSATSATKHPPSDGGRRWLIQQLAAAHGGWSSFASGPEGFAAEVFLRGDEPKTDRAVHVIRSSSPGSR